MVVTFVGTFSTYHNPEAIISAAKKLQWIPNLIFVLMGDGELRPILHQKALGLGNVIFTGWTNSASIAAVLKHSHLGLCTSGKTSERNFLPNKVFLCLAEGVPIASVFDGELHDLIEQHQIGFNFSSVDELTEGILRLYQDRVQLEQMAGRAQAFFYTHCDAANIYRHYADHIECFATGS